MLSEEGTQGAGGRVGTGYGQAMDPKFGYVQQERMIARRCGCGTQA